MKYRFFHNAAALQVLHDDALQQRRGDVCVPDTFRIHDDDRASFADTETRRLPSLDATGSKQEVFALEQCSEQTVQRPAAAVRRAVSARAHDHVMSVRFHRPWS